jgi:hypothetical protein
MSGPAIARALLVADATLIVAVPATRIITGVVPQSTALPCIGITETFATDHQTVRGHRAGRVKVTSLVQITVMAANYPDCKTYMDKARRALRDFAGTIGAFQGVTCRLDGKGPDFESDASFCAQTQDLRITYDEGP